RGCMMRVNPPVWFFVFGAFITLMAGCGGDNGTMGATASLSWDNHEQSGISYTVHYGRNSSGESGSCNYENAVDVTDPFVMIAGLEYSTRYYFAVSAKDNDSGLSSMCSEEVSKLTPEQEKQDIYIGDPPVKVG
ncbi:MAG TPA: fibronectin type III domain-containing protein, partial [Nitrospira sp.]